MHAEPPDDRHWNAQLRDVPVPPDLVERLRAKLLPTDEQLNQRLRAVSVPSSLISRLQAIPDDCLLDDALVTSSPSADPRWLERVAAVAVEIHPTQRHRTWQQRLVPMSVALAMAWILISLGGAGFSWWLGDYAVAKSPLTTTPVVLVDSPLLLVATSTPLPDAVSIFAPAEDFEPSANSVELAVQEVAVNMRVEWPDDEVDPGSGPVSEWFTSVRNGMQPWASVVQLRWGIFGAPIDDRDQILLEQPIVRSTQGIEPPPVPGYNRAFWLKHHVFPPLSPAIAGLEQSPLPLTANPAQFDHLAQLALAGRKPVERDVRVEDFVAHALGYLPAARAGSLELRTTLAPSPFGPSETQMLQCVVQAGPQVTKAPTHLLIAVDLSSSMKQHWPEIQRLLLSLPERMSPKDRLSLVAFAEEVELVLEALPIAEAELWRSQVLALRPAGGADLAEGLRTAISTAQENTSLPVNCRKELLFISDHEGIWDRDNLAALAEMLESAQQAKVQTSLIDLALTSNDEATCLRKLAIAADLPWYGNVNIGPREDHQSPLQSWQQVRFLPIASEVEMSITFNPQAVAAYRLVGHDGASWSDINAASPPLEFRPGDSRASMVELSFQPGRIDEIGRVELRWRNPADGEFVTRNVRLSRSQVIPNWTESPLWFQRSCVAAEMAETVHGTRQILREAGWSENEQHHLARVMTVLKNSPLDPSSDPITARLWQVLDAWRKLGIK